MTEYRKQAAFLKALLKYDDCSESRILCERLTVAEQNERCLLGACRLVAVVALLGVAGLGYSAVLLPQFFDNSTHVVVQFFSALGLGSLMCLGAFLGLWFWYRNAVNRIHDECRRMITAMVEARSRTSSTTFYPVVVDKALVSFDGTASSGHPPSIGTDFWTLPKAS